MILGFLVRVEDNLVNLFVSSRYKGCFSNKLDRKRQIGVSYSKEIQIKTY